MRSPLARHRSVCAGPPPPAERSCGAGVECWAAHRGLRSDGCTALPGGILITQAALREQTLRPEPDEQNQNDAGEDEPEGWSEAGLVGDLWKVSSGFLQTHHHYGDAEHNAARAPTTTDQDRCIQHDCFHR